MIKDDVEEKWHELKRRLQEKWVRFTDCDFDEVVGQKERLVGHLQERYGYVREQAEREADEFINSVSSRPI